MAARAVRDARVGAAWSWETVRTSLWRLLVTTVSSCLRYRVTGLAAEAAFFAVLSVPPLIFALAGAIGYVTNQFPPDRVARSSNAVLASPVSSSPSAVDASSSPPWTTSSVAGGST